MNPASKKPLSESLADMLGRFGQPPSISRWRDTAFTAAIDKFQKTKGNPETVMQTGEAFGRGLFSEYLQEHSTGWTMKKWFDVTDRVLTPMGLPLECMEITSENATSIVTRITFADPMERDVASLFTYGYLRGLFLSAFPKGELFMENSSKAPVTSFIFKTHASTKDRFERERVKQRFTSMK